MPVGSALRRKFGDNIRELRVSRGLTQQALADRSGLSVDAIRRAERGTVSPSLDSLSKLAMGLDISLRTLFSTFEDGARDPVEEVTDFLAKRTKSETRLVMRLVAALFCSCADPRYQDVTAEARARGVKPG